MHCIDLNDVSSWVNERPNWWVLIYTRYRFPGLINISICIDQKIVDVKFCFHLSYSIPGTPMWFLVQVAAIKNDKDVTVLFLLTFKDITLIKKPISSKTSKSESEIHFLWKQNLYLINNIWRKSITEILV